MEIIGFELFSEFNSFYPKVILVCIILFVLITSIAIKFNFSENGYLITILIALTIILSVSIYHTYNRTIQNPNYFSLTIYYTNENNQIIEDNEKQIVKNIIDNIINDKIPNNKKNLQVYKKPFGISYEEYNLLKECKNKYNFLSEFVNEKIIE